MRKWRPPDVPVNEEWQEVHQTVVHTTYRAEILNLSHGSVTSGNLNINKTFLKILTHFYWPGLMLWNSVIHCINWLASLINLFQQHCFSQYLFVESISVMCWLIVLAHCPKPSLVNNIS